MKIELIKYFIAICRFWGLSCFIPFGQFFFNLAYKTGEISITAFMLSASYFICGIIVLAVGGNYCVELDKQS